MFLKIGHRGAAGLEPENTLRSFRKAISLGVDMLELDVHLCQSGELVVIHDETMERTSDGKGPVRKKTLAELKKLDFGKGEKIPTLVEVLNLARGKVKVNIELKGKGTAEPVSELLGKLVRRKEWNPEDFLISSFELKEFEEFHRRKPRWRIGIIIGRNSRHILEMAMKMKVYSLHLPWKYATASLVRQLHQKGFKVFVWTVNQKEDIQKMKLLKVDGIFSDFPDRL